ncbi:hypothetical protein BDV18DRAFT_145081 [Aspergillus unguis]
MHVFVSCRPREGVVAFTVDRVDVRTMLNKNTGGLLVPCFCCPSKGRPPAVCIAVHISAAFHQQRYNVGVVMLSSEN